MKTVSESYREFQPFVLEDIRKIAARGIAADGSARPSMLTAHRLDDTAIHTGSLAQSQAPWAVTTATFGSHAADPAAHHAPVTVGGGLALTGQQIAVGAGNGISVNVNDTAVRLATNSGMGFVTGALAVGAGNGISVVTGTVAVALATNSGLAFGSGLLGLGTPTTVSVSSTNLVSGAGHVHAVTSSSSPGAAASLLASDATGMLTLPIFTASTRVRTPLLDTVSGSMAVQPATDLVLNPGSNLTKLATGKALQTNAFTSGWAGAGSRLDDGLSVAGKAAFEVDELTVRGRMRVYELLINQIRTTNGSMFVSSSGRASAVSGAGPYTITTETDHGFLVGDLVRAQRFTGTGVYRSDLQVTSVGSTTQFTGALQAGSDAPAVGMTFARLGSATDSTRRGSIYLSADDSGAPFLDVVDGIAAFSDWNTAGKIKVRVGKLTGITGQAGEYGFIAGSGFTTADNYMRLSSYTGEINNIPLSMYVSGVRTIAMSPTLGISIKSDQTGARRLNFVNASEATIGYLQTAPASSPKYGTSGNKSYLSLISKEGVAGAGSEAWVTADLIGDTTTAWLRLQSGTSTVTSIAEVVAGKVWLSGNKSTLGDIYIGELGVQVSSDAIALKNGTNTATVTINGGTAWHAGNFNPASYAALSGATFTGSVVIPRGASSQGSLVVQGTTYASHFNYSTAEDTYIRGGKATSKLYLNDSNSGDVLILNSSSTLVGAITSKGAKVSIVPAGTSEYPGATGWVDSALFLAGNTNLYGLYAGVSGSGNAWMQVGRNDSVNYYDLILQPNGRFVGIGMTGPTAALYVAGDNGGTQQMRLGHSNGSSYWGFGRDNVTTGDLIFTSSTAEKVRFSASGHIRLYSDAYVYSNSGYLVLQGQSITYLRVASGDIRIADDSAANVSMVVGGGSTLIGTTGNTYSAKLNVAGNIHSSAAITAEGYLQVKAASAPATASGWARIFLRSSDNALCAVMPSGNVRVIVAN